MFGPPLDIEMSFRMAGARDCAPCQKSAKGDGFVAVSKALTSVGHMKKIESAKMHFPWQAQYKRHVRQRC